VTEIAFPEFDLARMHANADEAADLLKTLSNPHRLLILCFLAEGEISVADLNDRLPLSQSALSQHLAADHRMFLHDTQLGVIERARFQQDVVGNTDLAIADLTKFLELSDDPELRQMAEELLVELKD